MGHPPLFHIDNFKLTQVEFVEISSLPSGAWDTVSNRKKNNKNY